MWKFCKYRCNIHRLPIETGVVDISRNEMCHLCDSNDIVDEFHYLMMCIFFNNKRKKKTFSYYCQTNANILKINQLISSHNIVVLEKLCKFIKVIIVNVSQPGLERYFVSAHVLYNLCICCIYLLCIYA
jgi:hypothetical protein